MHTVTEVLGGATCAAFSHDNSTIAVAVLREKPEEPGSKAEVDKNTEQPSGLFSFVCHEPHYLCVLLVDCNTGNTLHELDSVYENISVNRAYQHIMFSPDDKYVSWFMPGGCSSNKQAVADVSTGEVLLRVENSNFKGVSAFTSD